MKERKIEDKNKKQNYIKSIKCPNCGANLHPEEGSKTVKCSYCDSVSLYRIVGDEVKARVLKKTEKEKNKENIIIEEEKEETKENKIVEEVKEIETNNNIKAKNIIVNWRRISSAALAALVLGFGSTKLMTNKKNTNPVKSDKTISTEYNVNSKVSSPRSKFIPVSFSAREKEEITNMSLEDYEDGVVAVYKELINYFNYDNMIKDITAAYFLTNYDYIDEDLEQKLVEKGYIAKVNLLNEEGNLDKTTDGWNNIEGFYRLINHINDINQSNIQIAWNNGDMDLSGKLIEPSILCADKSDSEDVRSLFSNWANSYDLNKNSIRSNTAFAESMTILNDLSNSSFGANFLAKKACGIDIYNYLKSYMYKNYTTDELGKYFVAEDLDSLKWNLRKGTLLENSESEELSYIVSRYCELSHICFDSGNNELIEKLTARETNNKTLIKNI